MVLYIKRCFSFKLNLNLPDHSQFHKTPIACPPHLQPARHTYSLPATPTGCPPHLLPAHYTCSPPATPATPTACSHLQLAHHIYGLPATPTACPPHLQRMPMQLTCGHRQAKEHSHAGQLTVQLSSPRLAASRMQRRTKPAIDDDA